MSRVLPDLIEPSVEACVLVHVSGSRRDKRRWKVLVSLEGETDWREEASRGALGKEPRASELLNAPQLQGRSPDGFSPKAEAPMHKTVLPAVCFTHPQLCFERLNGK